MAFFTRTHGHAAQPLSEVDVDGVLEEEPLKALRMV